MPTGYTAAIEKGISLRNFILNCSRAMGACILQRDDSIEDPPKKREPSDYYPKRIEESKNKLHEIESLSEEELNKRAVDEYNEEVKRSEDYIHEKIELKIKYDNMLNKVKNWTPPSIDHQGLKDFMIEQIKSSINFDCNTSYNQEAIKELEMLTGKDWKVKKTLSILKDLDYYEKKYKEELENCKSQNEWIDQLYQSLPKE